MHSYNSRNDVVGTGPVIATWTRRMWNAQAKPNVVGEFGTSADINNPEQFHNGIWAGLAAGAAITPLDWNDSSQWGKMTPAMFEHLAHLGKFVADLPLAKLNPTLLDIQPADADLRAWGVGGQAWGIAWVQDVSLKGKPVAEVRESKSRRARLTVQGLADGSYRVRPFDTWQGIYVNESVAAASGGALTLDLPEFRGDMAVRIERA